MAVKVESLRNGKRLGPLARWRAAHTAAAQPGGSDDPALLAQMLQQPAAAAPAPAPAADPAPVEAPVARPRRRAASRPHPIASALGYLAAGALAVGLWGIDGYYTLVALRALGAPIVIELTWPWAMTNAGLLAWLIPLGVEAIEQALLRERGWLFAVFAGVSLVNMFATGYGLLLALTPHIADERALWGVVVLASAALAFGPGRAVIAAVRALIGLVR